MKRQIIAVLFLTLYPAASAVGQGPTNRDPNVSKLVTSDIELFWKAYDKATPANDLYVYRDEYLRKGSEGLKAFTSMRIGSSCSLVDAIHAAPKYYR